MRKLYSRIFLGLIAMLCSYLSFAQVSVTATAGTTGPTSYTTLKTAFDAVNAGTHQGVVTINITGNTTETASAVLNASGTPANYTAVNINTSGSFTVSMNLAAALIDLNGADNVTLNGNSTLTLSNTNVAGSVFVLRNDATTNMIKNVTIKGATNLVTSGFPTAGVINFGTGTSTGNDGNTFDNCDVDGTANASCLLFSSGSTTTTGIENSGNIIKNSKFHDNISNTLTTSMAIVLSDGNTDWTIQNNSIYHTAAISTTQQLLVRGILIVPDFTSDFHNVTGNFIGGNAANAAGTMSLTATGASGAIGFIGMDIETGGAGNTVSNNTVRNVTGTYALAAGSFSNAGIFGFIGGFNGTSTFSNNTVSNINLSNTGGFLTFNAIHVNARVTAAATVTPTFNVTGNTVNNLTLNSGTAGGDVQAHGIRLETSSSANLVNTSIANPTFNVTGNTVTNVSVPFAGAATFFRAIGTIVTQGGTSPNFSTAVLFPKADISNNNIHTISSSSTLANYGAAGVTGIHFGGASGANTTDIIKINSNTIYDLSATNTGDVGSVVTGILATLGVHEIQKNKIYDLKNSAVPTTTTNNPGIVGITVRNAVGTSNVFNNFISLGTGVTTNVQIYGLINNFNATGPINFTYNTVVVTGAGAAGNSKPTAAMVRGTETFGNTIATPVSVTNNIFYNTRTGGGKHYAVANTAATPATGWTSSYNNVYSSTAATVALWGTTDINAATYNTNASDANSKSVTVTFTNVATGDLHLTGASFNDANLNGLPVAGITTDIDGDARSASAPKMGADEPVCTTTTITTQPTAQTVCAGGALNLSVVATGTNLSYQWRRGGNNITGATSATYTVAAAAAGDAGNYDVVISSPCGNLTSNAVAVTVNTAPTITAQPTAQAACNGSNAVFTVTATGTGLTYQWQLNGANVTAGTGATTSTYTVPASAATTGNYTVIVSNGSCPVTSSAVALTITPATAITTQPTAVTACQGNATFTVAATGGNLTYQWKLNGNNVTVGTGGTTNTYTVPVTAANAGTYTVVVTGACGAVTSNNAVLTVQNCTSVPNVDADVTSMTLMPNLVHDMTTLRVVSTRTMKMNWNIVDAQGKVVLTISRQVMAGKNDIALYLGQLSSGTYHLQGATEKGTTNVLRFVKQ